MTHRSLHLAVELSGLTHDVTDLRSVTRLAEAAGFTLATFDDGPAAVGDAAARGVDAGSRAAYVALLTERIGLAPTLPVTTTEPFHLATQLASLDHLSGGRAAWIVTAPADAAALATVGGEALSAQAAGQEARDAVEVARRLWDSWEDDAIIRDVATGRFLDNDRLHPVDFHGATYDIVGPLITPRPPQGQVVVIADAALGLGDAVDIALIDIALVDIARLDAGAVGGAEPAPEPGIPLTFVDLPVSLAGQQDADALVTELSCLSGRVAGARLRPATRADLDELLEDVLPRLREAGLHRPPIPGATLRESLGLARPTNRFVVPA